MVIHMFIILIKTGQQILVNGEKISKKKKKARHVKTLICKTNEISSETD